MVETPATDTSVLRVQNASRVYSMDGYEIQALREIDLEVHRDEFLAVTGPSGCGKSTLLHLLGGVDLPTSGKVFLLGKDTKALPDRELTRLRLGSVGFVFQRFFLIPHITVFDNIRLRYALRGSSRKAAGGIAELTRRLGIEERLGHYPGELSVGEQQRVAVARALAGSPEIVLADEPTGNLDPENAGIIIECLREEARQGRSVVMVTHNHAYLGVGSGELRLVAGRAAELAGAGEQGR